MSHHFDTSTAKENPRIYACDLYIFEGHFGCRSYKKDAL
jgi:hypothetical protein